MNFLSKVLNFFPQILLDIKDEEFWQTGGPGYEFSFMKDFLLGLDKVLLPFMFTLAAVFSIYAIVLGVNYVRAENQTESKKKLIGAITSIIVIVALAVIFKFLVIPNMGSIFQFINSTFNQSQNVAPSSAQ